MKKIIKSVMLSLASIFIMFGCSNSASGVTREIVNCCGLKFESA